jgi:hypothetical protein
MKMWHQWRGGNVAQWRVMAKKINENEHRKQ